MRWFSATLVGVVFVMLSTAATAWAQQPTEVVGTADFRNPPTLVSGQYLDTIVTGDTVWYAVVYKNDTPYMFEVSLPGVDLDADDELALDVSFVAPTLESVDDSSGLLAGSGARYDSGDINVWYIRVMLETTGRLGVEHRLMLDIEGVQTTGFQDCTTLPECTFDDELAILDEQTSEVEAQLAVMIERGTEVDAQIDIESLREQLEAAETQKVQAERFLVAAETRLAELCAPAATCTSFPDPGSRTPIWAWVMGVLVFSGGVRVTAKNLRRSG